MCVCWMFFQPQLFNPFFFIRGHVSFVPSVGASFFPGKIFLVEDWFLNFLSQVWNALVLISSCCTSLFQSKREGVGGRFFLMLDADVSL